MEKKINFLSRIFINSLVSLIFVFFSQYSTYAFMVGEGYGKDYLNGLKEVRTEIFRRTKLALDLVPKEYQGFWSSFSKASRSLENPISIQFEFPNHSRTILQMSMNWKNFTYITSILQGNFTLYLDNNYETDFDPKIVQSLSSKVIGGDYGRIIKNGLKSVVFSSDELKFGLDAELISVDTSEAMPRDYYPNAAKLIVMIAEAIRFPELGEQLAAVMDSPSDQNFDLNIEAPVQGINEIQDCFKPWKDEKTEILKELDRLSKVGQPNLQDEAKKATLKGRSEELDRLLKLPELPKSWIPVIFNWANYGKCSKDLKLIGINKSRIFF